MYTFKFWQEAVWGGAIAALLFALQAIVDTDSVTDWSAWGITLAGGVARAFAGAIIAALTQPGRE